MAIQSNGMGKEQLNESTNNVVHGGLTVEERIEQESGGQSVADILDNYARQGYTSKQVAEILDCGVSNVRRIARKYNISFNQQEKQHNYFPEDFLGPLNDKNILSKRWDTKLQTETA